MRYKVIILSVLFTMLPVFLFAQNSSLEYESNLKLDIRASEFSSMNLTKIRKIFLFWLCLTINLWRKMICR